MNTGNPVPILNEDQYRAWTIRNMAAFDRLPDDVRQCLQEENIEADCQKLLGALANGVPETMVIDAIMHQARMKQDRRLI